MDPATVIGLAALGMSALTLVALQLTARRAFGQGYVEQLERRIGVLEAARRECMERIEQLEEENLRLLRRVFQSGDRKED